MAVYTQQALLVLNAIIKIAQTWIFDNAPAASLSHRVRRVLGPPGWCLVSLRQAPRLIGRLRAIVKNHTVVPRILEKQQFNHEGFFSLVFDFGTEFFSTENYAKHLVRTLPLGRYANNLSVACQGKAGRGQGESHRKHGRLRTLSLQAGASLERHLGARHGLSS